MSILTLVQGTEVLEMLLPIIRSNFEKDGVLVPTMMVMAEKDVETKKPLQRPSLMVSLMPQLPPETIRQILQKTVADLDVSMMILAVQAMSVGHLPLEEAKAWGCLRQRARQLERLPRREGNSRSSVRARSRINTYSRS